MKNLSSFVFLFSIYSFFCLSKTNEITQSPNSICTICYSYSANILLLCNHKMCSSCLSNIRKTNNKCPYCRDTIHINTTIPYTSLSTNNDNIKKIFSLIRNNHYRELKTAILKISINTKDEFGNTALHIAAQNNCVKITKLLLQRNANISIKNNTGKTAIHYANTYRYTKIINLLLSQTTNTSTTDHKGKPIKQEIK